nr:T-cell receptor alpha chain V region 2B4 precursor [Salmo salar]
MVLCLIIWLVLDVFCFECTGDHVQQQPGGVIATEGGLVTLSCQYNTSANNNNAYLFWYKQEENDFPKHMLTRFSFGSGDNAGGFKERFNASLNAKTQSVPLTIQRLQLSDSAVYYCALRTVGGGSKIIFGTGTRLILKSREKHEPSYYTLNSSNTTACLATDFSAHKANSNSEVFNNTEATRVKGDSYYSQVALEKNCTKEDGSEKCEANWYFDTDAKINFLSLTILGLRILFLKTIVFNVLMTLRLWMS